MDCVPRALLEQRVPEDSRWLAGKWIRNACEGTGFLRLDGIELEERTI